MICDSMIKVKPQNSADDFCSFCWVPDEITMTP